MLDNVRAGGPFQERTDAEVLFGLLLIKRNASEVFPLILGGPDDVVHQPVDGYIFVLVLEAGEGPDQAPCRVADDGGVHGVQIAACPADGKPQIGDSLHSQGENRSAGPVPPSAFPQAGIGALEEAAIFLDESPQIGAADLLLSFDDPLDSEWNLSDLLLICPDGLNAGHPRPLVIGYAAGPNAAVSDFGVEGAGIPQFEGLSWLHVVVVVDHQRLVAAAHFAVDDRRSSFHLDNPGVESNALQPVFDPVGGLFNAYSLRNDARLSTKLLKLGQKLVLIGLDVGLESIHWNLLR